MRKIHDTTTINLIIIEESSAWALRAGLGASNKMTPDKSMPDPIIDTLIKTSMLSAVTDSELTPRFDRSNVTSHFYFVPALSLDALRRVLSVFTTYCSSSSFANSFLPINSFLREFLRINNYVN